MKSLKRICRSGLAVVFALAFGSLSVAAADGAAQTCLAKALGGPSATLVEAEAYIDLSDLNWLSGGRSSGGSSTDLYVSPCARSNYVCPTNYCVGCPCCKDKQGTACTANTEIQCVMEDNCVYNCECISGPTWDCGWAPPDE